MQPIPELMPHNTPSPQDLTFEEALEHLEALVERLEDDPPALEEAIDAYEDGVALAEECLSRLNDAEQRIQELSLD